VQPATMWEPTGAPRAGETGSIERRRREGVLARGGFWVGVLLCGVAVGGCAKSSVGPAQPAPAAQLAFTVQPSNAAAGAMNTPAVQVAVQDAQGNTVTTATTNITVAIGTNPASGTLAGTKTVAAVNGVATFSTLSLSAAGTGYTLTAAATGLTGATSNAFNISSGAAATLVFTMQPSTAAAGAAITPAVQVTIQDAQGNTVTTATTNITVAIGTNPASGTLAGTKSVAAVNGVATFSTLSLSAAGTGYTLTAAATGLTGATSNAFNISSGAAAKLVFIVQPSNAVAGAAITPGVQVALQDAQGNTLTTATTSITLAIGTNPASGALAGTTTVAAVNGVATFANVSINNPGIGYALTASATSLTGATSSSFNISTAAPITAGHLGLSLGYLDACGVTTSGAAYCWGFSYYGELGNGSNNLGPEACGNYCSSTPVAVSGGHSFSTVSAGGLHACGVTTSGAAYCWGDDSLGALGNGSTTNSAVPVAVSGGLSFATVSGGWQYTCGVTTGGAAYCWGEDSLGTLGNGSTTTYSSTPVAVSGGLSFASVSAGPEFACGVTTGGAAYCWGGNATGELGNGSTTNSRTPVAVAGGLSFATVSASYGHACGVTTAGAAYCWGGNGNGELGYPIIYSFAPVPVSGGLSFATVSAGAGYTCGVTTAGAAYCWGDNSDGELGNGSTSPYGTYIPTAVSGGLSFATVSAGGFTTCGVSTSGAAYCWGNNSNGQFGNGSTTPSLTPVAVASGLSF